MTGLQKQSITLNFGAGVDTKTDPKLVVPGKLLELENGVFKKGGAISKRNGTARLAESTTDEEVVPAGESVASFNDELVLFAAQEVFSYAEGLEKWINKGSAVSAIINTKQVVKNTASQTQGDSAVVNGIGVYAWEDSRGGVRASVFDENTGTPILADTVLDASASRPRCLAFASYLFVFYYKSGVLYARRVSPLVPGVFDAAVTISSTVNTTNPTYDIMVSRPDRICYAHNVQGASEIKVHLLDSSLAADTVSSAATIAEAGTNCIGLVLGTGSRVHLTYHNGTNALRTTILNTGLATLVAPFTLDATTSPTIVNVTGYLMRSSTTIKWFYQVSAADSYNHFVKTNTSTEAGVAGTAAVFMRSVGLASKAFKYYAAGDSNDRAYVGLVHGSTLQSTYFVARNDGYIIAKMQPSLAYGLTPRPILANVSAVSAATFSFAVMNKTRLVSEESQLLSLTGVARTQIDFTNSQIFNTAQLGNNLHIVGGILSMYDGASVVEHGFHLYPENIELDQDTTGGSLSDGTYQVVAVYEWTDNYGQRHQSAPSIPVSITLNGGGSTQIIEVTCPTLRITEKKGDRTNVVISFYRTEDGGTTFYKTSSVASPTYNDVTADTVVVDLTASDASIASNEILYTTGGILENIAAPSASTIAVYRNRVILCGLENPNEFWYSKSHVKGEPVAFSDSFTKTVESEGGGLIGPWVLDDKLTLFKRQRIYIMAGDGPPDTGDTNLFNEPELINTDTGCSNWNSLVYMPSGIMRKTDKGIYLLRSNLSDEYIGAEIEGFNGLTITSANLRSTANQVRFTTLEGVALVYDYFVNQWGTFGYYKANDSIIWKNFEYVLLRADGKVYMEDSGYKDAGSSVPIKATTSWIALDGVLGFQRVYWLSLLAEYKSPHTLLVRVGYDFAPGWLHTIVFNPDTALPTNVYGDGVTYGSSTPYGGNDGGVYLLESRLTRQKCQSIRFQIEELVTSATEGSQEGLTLAAFSLEIGVKTGGSYTSSSNRSPASTGGS